MNPDPESLHHVTDVLSTWCNLNSLDSRFGCICGLEASRANANMLLRPASKLSTAHFKPLHPLTVFSQYLSSLEILYSRVLRQLGGSKSKACQIERQL